MCKAALNGASLNVYINTKLMKDTDVADDMNTRADELIIRGNQMADEVYDRVMDCVEIARHIRVVVIMIKITTK